MTVPSIALGLVVALLIGALFHLFLGGGLGRLILYLALSLIGFCIRSIPRQLAKLVFVSDWNAQSWNGSNWQFDISFRWLLVQFGASPPQ